MSEEDKWWHRRQHIMTRHSIVFCAWLVSLQHHMMWPAFALTLILFFCCIAAALEKSKPPEEKP